jgi:hypothetical protein
VEVFTSVKLPTVIRVLGILSEAIVQHSLEYCCLSQICYIDGIENMVFSIANENSSIKGFCGASQQRKVFLDSENTI